MKNDHSIRRFCSFWILAFSVISIFAGSGLSQTPPASGSTHPEPIQSQEKKFLRNILDDQRGIWTSPFHWHGSDLKWAVPLGLSTAALIATDQRTSQELVEGGENRSRLRISKDISYAGSLYATGSVAAVFYLAGRAGNNARARETGLLGAEALINSQIVVHALKLVSQRERPQVEDSAGKFFVGGASFPSGHAISAWSLATIVAQEYHHPAIKLAAYGVATAVSVSRFTARKHFLSDVLVGSALGYGIGRYVYHHHHDPALDASNGTADGNDLLRTDRFPRIDPIYRPRTHTYGAALTWSF